MDTLRWPCVIWLMHVQLTRILAARACRVRSAAAGTEEWSRQACAGPGPGARPFSHGIGVGEKGVQRDTVWCREDQQQHTYP